MLHELSPVRVLHKGTNCNLNAPGGPVVVYLGQGVSVLGVVDGSGACTVPPVDIVLLGSSVFRREFTETDAVVTFTWPKDTHDGGKKTHASSKSRLLVKQSPPICIGRAAGTQSIQCAFGTIDATGSGWTSSQYAIPTLFPAVLTERGICGLLHMQPAESPLVQRTSMFERGMYDCRDGVCMGYRVLYDEFSGHRRVYATMSGRPCLRSGKTLTNPRRYGWYQWDTCLLETTTLPTFERGRCRHRNGGPLVHG